MRPSNKQRSRNKSGNNNNGNNQQRRPNMGNIINRVFESAGPDGKVRGTPQQIIDKYQLLARDAQLAGDRVAAESYLQHSEHYSRLLGDAQRQQQENNRFNQERDDFRRDDEGGFRDGGGQPGGQQGGHQGGPREDGEQRRYDDGFDRRPQPQMSQPVASGLAMIDPDDSFDMAGPIETPEGRRNEQPQAQPVVAVQAPPIPQAQPMLSPMMPPMPEVEAEVQPAGADAAAEAAPDAERPAKRPRTRRRAKPAEAADAAPADAEPVPQAD